jgi:hypothetical protein
MMAATDLPATVACGHYERGRSQSGTLDDEQGALGDAGVRQSRRNVAGGVLDGGNGRGLGQGKPGHGPDYPTAPRRRPTRTCDPPYFKMV